MTTRAASGPMDLLSQIRALQKGTGTTCTAGAFIATLTDEQRSAVSAARAEGITASTIGRWLRSLGYPGTEASAGRHILGHCACPKS